VNRPKIAEVTISTPSRKMRSPGDGAMGGTGGGGVQYKGRGGGRGGAQ
jgi:hypothetical protein